MSIIQTKDDDATLAPQDEGDSGSEENYETGIGSYNTTLRKSAVYALNNFANLYPEATFLVLKPYFDQALQLALIDPKQMEAFHTNP